MRAAISNLVVTAGMLAALPGASHAQGVEEVLATIRNGGGWVSVPIEAGQGTASTVMLPTLGLRLSGCVSVWEGHTGEWRIRAHDTVAEDTVSVASTPGQNVRFSHEFGMRSQLEFDFAWSEPRDTTLFLWVGLDREDDGPGEACTPK